MAENYTIEEATIVSIGDMQQINYEDKQTGQQKVFTKFEFVCRIGDVETPFESNGFNRDKLEVGSRYSFEAQDKGQYTDSIRNITKLEGSAAPVPTPQPSAAPVTETPKPVPPAMAQRVDLQARWREYNTNARTSQMQATERVGKYIDLLLAGKLLNDAGEAVDKVRKSTIENWYAEEIDRFWKEHDVRIPQDTWGNLDGSIS